MATTATESYPYRYSWGQPPCGDRKGQRCKIIKKTLALSGPVLVEFMDGARFQVSRASLKRA